MANLEKVVEQASDKVSYGGATVGIIGGGMSSNDIALYGGLLIAALTFLVNLYYKYKADRRAEIREEGHRRGDIPVELRKVNNDE